MEGEGGREVDRAAESMVYRKAAERAATGRAATGQMGSVRACGRACAVGRERGRGTSPQLSFVPGWQNGSARQTTQAVRCSASRGDGQADMDDNWLLALCGSQAILSALAMPPPGDGWPHLLGW